MCSLRLLLYANVFALSSSSPSFNIAAPPPAPCKCAEQEHCKSLQTPLPAHEVFTFSLAGPGANLTDQYYRYDWTSVTTAAWMTAGDEATCW